MATFVLRCISEVLLCLLLKLLLLELEYLKFKEFFAIASFLLFRVSSKFISLLSDSICFLLLLSRDLNLLLLLVFHLLLIFITNSNLYYFKDFKYHSKSNIREPQFSPKNFLRIFRVPRVGPDYRRNKLNINRILLFISLSSKLLLFILLNFWLLLVCQ